MKTKEKYEEILNYMQLDVWYKTSEFESVVDLKKSRIKEILADMLSQNLIETTGNTKGKKYRKIRK